MKEQCTLLAMQTSQSADELERAGKTLNAKLAELDTVKEQCTLLAKQKDELERTCRLLSEQKVVQEREFQEITSAQEREFQELSSKVACCVCLSMPSLCKHSEQGVTSALRKTSARGLTSVRHAA